MLLKKSQVLRFIPKVKTLRHEAMKKAKQGQKLTREATEALRIADALRGIVLHDNFPVLIMKYDGGTEVASGCSDVKRAAFVKHIRGTKKFVVTTYLNNDTEVDG